MDGPARARAFAVALLAGLIALVALVAAPGVDAKPKKKKAVPVKVMTRNIFLGADLGPALAANTFKQFTRANGNILAEVDQTNFPLRAQALAAEIMDHKPDLVGLQEVAWWRTNPTPGAPAQGPDGVFTATDTRYDFLQLLLDQVSAQGGDYTPAVVKTEFDFEAPADTDNDSNTGLEGGDIQGRLTMRDVILVNDDSKVKAKLKNPQTGTFSSLFTPNISGIDVPVTRGWTAGDVTVKKGKGKKKVKKTFRFVNSHFEAFDDEKQVPSIRAQQARPRTDPRLPRGGCARIASYTPARAASSSCRRARSRRPRSSCSRPPTSPWSRISSVDYKATIDDPRIDDVRILRPQEIPRYVAEGLFDLGITGRDWIEETGQRRRLASASCATRRRRRSPIRVVVAVPRTRRHRRSRTCPQGCGCRPSTPS